MKKNLVKLISCMMCFIFIMSFSFVFAGEEEVLRNISNTLLNALKWFAYAIAFGVLIIFGIKYMMSGANDKANLKGMAPKFLIGIALIVLCTTIASIVAEIAGNEGAEDIIAVGESVGITFVDTVTPPEDGNASQEEKSYCEINGHEMIPSETGREVDFGNNTVKVTAYCKNCSAQEKQEFRVLPEEVTNADVCPQTGLPHTFMENTMTGKAQCTTCFAEYSNKVEDNKVSTDNIVQPSGKDDSEVKNDVIAGNAVVDILSESYEDFKEAKVTSYNSEDGTKFEVVEYYNEKGDVIAKDTYEYYEADGKLYIDTITHSKVGDEGNDIVFTFNESVEQNEMVGISDDTDEKIRIWYDEEGNVNDVEIE